MQSGEMREERSPKKIKNVEVAVQVVNVRENMERRGLAGAACAPRPCVGRQQAVHSGIHVPELFGEATKVAAKGLSTQRDLNTGSGRNMRFQAPINHE